MKGFARPLVYKVRAWGECDECEIQFHSYDEYVDACMNGAGRLVHPACCVYCRETRETNG